MLSLTIEDSDSLGEIMRKIEVVEDLNECLRTLGSGPLSDICSRFLNASDLDFERFINRLIGFNISLFSTQSRILLLKACSTVFPNPYALEAAFAVLVNTPPSSVPALKNGLDGNHCLGYFNLYSLVYTMLDVKVELHFLKEYPKLYPTKDSKINLMDHTLMFFQNNPSPTPEIRLVSVVNDVMVATSDPRYKSGKIYPGVMAYLRQFNKFNQTDIVFVDSNIPSRFVKSVNKRIGNVVLECSSRDVIPTTIAKYCDLYPNSQFMFVTNDASNLIKVNLSVRKVKGIQNVSIMRTVAIKEPTADAKKSKIKRARSSRSKYTPS